MKMRRFFGGLIVWELVMILAIGILIIRAETDFRLQREDVKVFGPILLSGLIVATVCALIQDKFAGVSSVMVGSGVGVASVVAVGLIWASHARGFELRPGLVTASLMLCIPSGIGGGIIGWLYRRRGMDGTSSGRSEFS